MSTFGFGLGGGGGGGGGAPPSSPPHDDSHDVHGGGGGGGGGGSGSGGGGGADVEELLAQPLGVGSIHIRGLVRTREAFVRRVLGAALADTAAAAAAEAAAEAAAQGAGAKGGVASAAAAAAAAAWGAGAAGAPPPRQPTFGDTIEGLSEGVERLRSTGAFHSVTAVLDEGEAGEGGGGGSGADRRTADVRLDVVERKLYSLQTTTSVEGSGERQASLEGKLRWRNVFGNAEKLALSCGWYVWGAGMLWRGGGGCAVRGAGGHGGREGQRRCTVGVCQGRNVVADCRRRGWWRVPPRIGRVLLAGAGPSVGTNPTLNRCTGRERCVAPSECGLQRRARGVAHARALESPWVRVLTPIVSSSCPCCCLCWRPLPTRSPC